MDSAGSVPESVWNVLDTLARVPIWMWAVGAVAGFFGIIVLVFPFSAFPYNQAPAMSRIQSVNRRRLTNDLLSSLFRSTFWLPYQGRLSLPRNNTSLSKQMDA